MELQDQDIEAVVRKHLPFATDDECVPQDVELGRLGLDSMRTISLLLELEDTFGITFPEDQLLPEIFATTGTILRAVRQLTGMNRG